MKGLYTEHNKMLIKELEDYSKKWKDIPCFLFESITIVKVLILPKVIYKLSAIPIKTPMMFFRAVGKWQPTPVFLPGESQGGWSLVGCRLWGRTESDTTQATWQQPQQPGSNTILRSL